LAVAVSTDGVTPTTVSGVDGSGTGTGTQEGGGVALPVVPETC